MNMHARKITPPTPDSVRQIGVVASARTIADAFAQHIAAEATYLSYRLPDAISFKDASPIEDAFGDALSDVDDTLYSRVEKMPIRTKADALAALAWLIHEHSEFQCSRYPDKVGSPYDSDDATAKLLADLATFIASTPDAQAAPTPKVPALAENWYRTHRAFNACEWTDGCPEEKAWQEAERAVVETPSTGLADLIAKARVVNTAFTGSENLGVIDPLAHSIIADLLRLGGERNLPEWKNP